MKSFSIKPTRRRRKVLSLGGGGVPDGANSMRPNACARVYSLDKAWQEEKTALPLHLFWRHFFESTFSSLSCCVSSWLNGYHIGEFDSKGMRMEIGVELYMLRHIQKRWEGLKGGSVKPRGSARCWLGFRKHVNWAHVPGIWQSKLKLLMCEVRRN